MLLSIYRRYVVVSTIALTWFSLILTIVHHLFKNDVLALDGPERISESISSPSIETKQIPQ